MMAAMVRRSSKRSLPFVHAPEYRCSFCVAGAQKQEETQFSQPLDIRMPAETHRPRPVTAAAVVEQYRENLWRDFFTNPDFWEDNRFRKNSSEHADFKHRITKENLWIDANWNPPWVRVELSLMTHFQAVPLDSDPQLKEDENHHEEAVLDVMDDCS